MKDKCERKNDVEEAAMNLKEQRDAQVLETAEVDKDIYPCDPFDFCCPDRETCQHGKNCPWHE